MNLIEQFDNTIFGHSHVDFLPTTKNAGLRASKRHMKKHPSIMADFFEGGSTLVSMWDMFFKDDKEVNA